MWKCENVQNIVIDIRYPTKKITLFYLLSHILVQIQNERFHHQCHSSSSRKLFSLCSSRAIFQLQFLGNFSSGSEVGQKGLPVDSCTNIESSHATATYQCQTDFRQKADSSSESENFPESHNQRNFRFSREKILSCRYRFSELEEGIISRVHLWMPIYIGTFKKYGEARHRTSLNKNVKRGNVFHGSKNYINRNISWGTDVKVGIYKIQCFSVKCV